MTVFLFFIGLAQCLLIWLLARSGKSLRERAARDKESARHAPPGGWPACAMIIPVSGNHPQMEKALRSLLEQDYPDYSVIAVTASEDDPVCPIIRRLMEEYSRLKHAIAGNAVRCGQKNHNLLAGAACAREAPILVFCDSTHAAQPDFLRCLVLPIARGEAAFSTGYHEVLPGDPRAVTLAYAISVLFMRFMQGIGAFTQPWGGALAMSRQAFEQWNVAGLWETNVVDDCSLAAWLQKNGVHTRLCPAALLGTTAKNHALAKWRAWLERQILFLKFCMPAQWLGLGLIGVLMIVPPVWAAIAMLIGILGCGGNMAPFLALCWFFLFCYAGSGWRSFVGSQTGTVWNWIKAFLLACLMFGLVFFKTISARSIVWQNVVYRVGKDGVVEDLRRK